MTERKTPKYGHAPIVMRRVETFGNPELPGNVSKLGDSCWRFNKGQRRVLVVAIPCGGDGKGDHWILSEWTIDHKNECNAQWKWDGDVDKPTLTPSLHAVGIWHGKVTKGMLHE